jgi:DNA-binding transcriptional ArsR family regulator
LAARARATQPTAVAPNGAPPALAGPAGPAPAATVWPATGYSAVARESVLTPLDPGAPHPPPAPVQPGEMALPYPRELVRRAAETFGALSDPSRAQIVAALLVRELSVGDLAAAVGLTQSATSHHLRLLRDRRLVRHHRHGNQVYYSIDDVHVAAMFAEAFRHIRHVHEALPDHPYALGAEPRPAAGAAGGQ